MTKVVTSNKMQRDYWNNLADSYQSKTEISLYDFHYGPQIPGERRLRLLPELRDGQTALELGCGAAQNSVWLARKGLVCTGVDISAEQLRHARRLSERAGVEIELVESPIESFLGETNATFDFIHSSHAFEFVENPAKVVAGAAARLNPGGHLMISTDHPLYHGDWIEGVYEDIMDPGGDEINSDGIFLTNYFSPPDDIRTKDGRVDVVAHAYPISAWFRWLTEAGLAVTRLAEPPAVKKNEDTPYTTADWQAHDGMLDAIPGTLILLARSPR